MVKYDIPNFSNYFLGDDLQVYNKKTGRILEGNINTRGYLKITMINDKGEKSAHGLHYIIAMCCIPKPELIVNHIDNNKLNNRISNLEWVTPSENRKHSFQSGNVNGNCFVQVKDNSDGKIYFFHSYKKCADHYGLHTTTVQSRCKLGDEKVWPGGLQFRSPASKEPFPEITDIERSLLDFGTSKSVSVKNLSTGKITKFEKLGEAALFVGISPGALSGHFKRNTQPVIRDNYQFKMDLDPDDWLPPKKLTNFPVEVIDTKSESTMIYKSVAEAARANDLKPTALAYRLDCDHNKVWSDGKKYRKL